MFQLYFVDGQVFTTDRRYSTTKYSSELKGFSEFVVLYNITFSNGKDKTATTQAYLQLGERFSKFLDVNTIKRDSLLKEQSNFETVGAKEINELGKYNVIYKKNVLKDLSSNTIFVQERVSKNVYQYQEPIPKQNWILTNDKMTILGYQCRSAKLTFRGRNYIAWYATGIPKSDGPYIFAGLPGLVLKITDEQQEYDFSAIAIEKKKVNIYWRNEKNIVTVSRDDFRKIQRNYFENPGLFLSSKAYDETGKEMLPQIPTRYYNPLELE